MTTLIEKSILNERLEKSRSGTYADTSENRRKHRVGQKYGSEKKEGEKPEKTDPNKMSPEQQLEAINKVIAAVNEGKLKLPPEEINTLVAKKTMAEEAVKQAKGEKKPEKKEEPKKEATKPEAKSEGKDELKTAQEELQRIKDKKDSWVAKYGKNSYDTRLQQAKDEVERLKNKKRSEKEKKSDEKSAKKAEEMKERIKGSEKSEPKKDKASDPIYQVQQKKKEASKKYDSKREEARQKYDKEADEIRSEIDKLYESDHPDAAKKRKELWNTLKEKTNKYDAETSRLKDEYEAEYKKLDEAEDKLYDQRQKEETSEEVEESYTRVKFEDVPNSGKVNLKKYLSEKMKRSADEAWGDISKIDAKGLQKMEKGLVEDFNRQFDDLPKSRRAEKLYAIIKVKGELSKRGKESQKKE